MTDTDPEALNEVIPLQLELSEAPDLDVDQDRRTITGLILPYDVRAERTSAGQVLFKPNSLKHHPDLARVKLLIDHQANQSVGVMTDIVHTNQGVLATFRVPEGPDGDEALAKAANGVRDGLSVGADVTLWSKSADLTHHIVRSAYLNEVSLVALPAFGDARVATVKASQPQGDPMPDTTLDAQPESVEHTQTPAAALEQTASAAPYAAVQASQTAHDATHTIATVIRNGGRASDVMAALSDVVPGDDAGQGFLRDQWLGEYWTAARTATPLFDLFNDGQELTSMKLKGWRWTTRPEVDDYAGDKVAIPSNTVATEPAEADAFRYAGGWDIDRIYVDLGNGDMVEALFQAAVEDSRQYLEAKVVTTLAAEATTVPSSADLPSALAAIGLEAATIGANVSVFSFAGDVWAQFLAMGADALPWWVTAQTAQVNISDTSANVGNVVLAPNPALPAGTILAGDRRAAKARNKRVRVNAIDIAHGGVDLGVFGYAAVLVQDPRALWTTTITGGGAGGGE